MRTLRRLLGAALAVLTVVPLFRLLAGRPTGPWGEATIRQAETSLAVAGWGIVLAVLLGIVAATVARGLARRRSEALHVFFRRFRGAVLAVPGRGLLIGAAIVAALAAGWVSRVLLQGLLTNIDEMAMWVHARYFAAGSVGGWVGSGAAHWLIPNTLLLDGVWLSQYPPGHVALLALAHRLGVPHLLGPALAALIAGASAAAFLRLLPDRALVARAAVVVVALSPMLAVFGAGTMSHLSALAFAAVAVWAALRARDGTASWALLAGASVGLSVLSRPWSGLTLAALPVWVWVEARARLHPPGVARRVALWALGGLPFAVTLAWYNHRLFGAVTRLGYEVSYGAGHRLGFHVDPWGYPYGPLEALGYTSADLVAFGLQLMESPIPLTVVGALFLLLASRLTSGERVLAAWALLPLLGAFLYWFHQPRMLFESIPGWAGLGVLGAAWWMRETSGRPRTVALATLGASIVLGLFVFAPQRVARYQWSAETLARIRVPELPDSRPALVFVHASWNERLSARLQAAGMRADSLNPVLRRNDACDVETHAGAREAGQPSPRPLDRSVAPGGPPTLERVETGPSLGALVDRTRAWTPECVRNARADRFGAVALAPLLWQGDLPGLGEERGVMFARDLGPEGNAALLAGHPGRVAYVFAPVEAGGPPVLSGYAAGMDLLWGAPAEAPRP